MLQVVNRLSVGSLGVDSLAGAPPPGYTSQQDTASPLAVVNDDEGDGMLKSSPLPPSMEYKDPLPTLPSPYSIEDLRVRNQTVHEQDQIPRHSSLHQNSTHGYTQTHSQNTPARSSSYFLPQQQLQQQQHDVRPLSWDALHFYSPPQILSTDNLFGATNEQTRPYYRCSTEEHWQPPVQVDNQHQHQQLTSPYTDYSLPTSPYHDHRQNTQPLRVLTYPSTDEGHYGYKEYGNEDEGNPSSLQSDRRIMMMMMNSTATILSPSEEPLRFQSTQDLPRRRRRRLPSPPNSPTRQATIATDRTKSANKTKSPTAKPSAKAHSTPPPLPLTQSQPTNHVYISRKCNPSMPISKSRGWRRKTVVQPSTQIPPPPKLPSSSSSSAITGTFTINPELYIPPSLLNAMEDPVFFRFQPSDTEQGETKKTKESRRRINLRLEVENGGIDVDIHLVPTTTISNNVGGEEEATCTRNHGQQDTSLCETPVRALTSASTSTTAFSGPPSSTTHPRQSTTSVQENPSGGTMSSRKGISPPEVTQHISSSKRDTKKKPSLPTTIDLQIKQACQQDSLNMQNQDSVKINGPVVLPLIARIVSFKSRYWLSGEKEEKSVFFSFDFVSLHFFSFSVIKTNSLLK